MGSVKRPVMPVEEIVRLYVDGGESAGMVSLRARIPTYRVREILQANGVHVRGPGEAVRLALSQRRQRELA
jgi:hypothetical protein